MASVYDEGDFVVIFDLKSGYHHISIAKEHRKFLGFGIQDVAGLLSLYVFCMLPIGLSAALCIFYESDLRVV